MTSMTRARYKVEDRIRFVSNGAMFGSVGTVKFVRKDGHLIVHFDGQPEGTAMFVDLTDAAPERGSGAASRKSSRELERDVQEALAAPATHPMTPPHAPKPSLTVRQINAIARAADGRNIYLIRERLGQETIQRVVRARTRGLETEVRSLATGNWLPVLPERGDKLEVR